MAFPFANLFTPSRSTKEKLYGKKPEYGTPETAAAEATKANLANLPEAEKLAGQVNTFNASEMSRLLEQTQPGFAARQKKVGDIFDARLAGQFTTSELDQLQLASASRGVESGTQGSQFNQANLARNLGLFQWQETQKTIDSFSRWTQGVAQLTQPAAFNIGSSFISPQQQFDYNKLAADTKAAPNPAARGAFDSKMAMAGILVSGYSGGQGYNQAYRPPSQPSPSGGVPQYAPQYNTVSGPMGEPSPGYGSGGPYE